MSKLVFRPPLLCAGVVAFCACSAFSAEIKVTVVNIDGEEESRVLTGIDESSFNLTGGTVAAKTISQLRFNEDSAQPQTGATATIYLRNGDLISVKLKSGDDSKLTFSNEALGEITLDNKFIDGLVLTQKEKPPAEQIDAFMKQPLTEDLLLMPKGDIAKGAMEKISDKDLNFNVEKQSKQYTFEQALAVRLVPLDEYKAPTDFRATIQLTDGSRLTAKLHALKENGVEFEGIDGKTWTAAVSSIRSFAFKGGNQVYLSDLNPKDVDEKPYAGGVPVVFHWRRDQSTAGRTLSMAGKTFDKGIGMHSYTRLTYDLGGQYAKFLSLAGVDGGQSQPAVCAWKVSVDGKEAASGIAHANEPPKPVKVDLNGAKELELVCDYGPDDDDAGDHLDWANARLIKR